MRIERIGPSPRKRGRMLVWLEDGACLKITEQELLDFGLRAGDDLSADALSRLKAAAGISNVKAKAAEMLSKRALSRRELERKLVEKGASPEEASGAADAMAAVGALDDRQYAASLIRVCAAKGYGPARARAKLYEKGVPKELWEEALADLPEEAGQIDAYLRHKLLGADPDAAEKRRLTAALLRRGYDWGQIRAAWGRIGQELDED